MARFFALAIAACLMGSGSSSYAAPPQPLSECSSEPRSGNYYLTGDLDCAGGRGVHLADPSGMLELGGFAIRNAEVGVFCSRCTIIGPGTIEDSLEGVEGYGIALVNVTLRNIQGSAVRALRRIVAESSLIENSGTGIQAPRRAVLINSQVTGNRLDGIRAFGQKSLDEGCVAGRVTLNGSTVTGNNVGPATGSECTVVDINGCADIRTCARPPRLRNGSSCGTSLSAQTGTPWGVCTLD